MARSCHHVCHDLTAYHRCPAIPLLSLRSSRTAGVRQRTAIYQFAQFLKDHGIKHILLAPYHPSSNGLAERFVRTFKRAMIAGEKDGRTPSNRLAEFLLRYRASAHTTTGVAPSELFLQRRLRTIFDLLKPDTRGMVTSKQTDQKQHHDKHVKLRDLFVGTPVMVRDYHHSHQWIPGRVLKKLGPVTYSIDIGDGRIWKRHIDQLSKRFGSRKRHIDQLTERFGSRETPESPRDAPNKDDGFQYPAQPEKPSQLWLCRHPSDGSILSVTGDHPRDSCSFSVNGPSQLEGRRCGDLNTVEL